MDSLLITPASEADFRLSVALLEKMNVAAEVLSEEDREDAGLGLLMREAQGSPLVSRATVTRELGRP